MDNKKIPWNKGKRKPIVDEWGYRWCNCVNSKLIHIIGFRGNAFCMLCKNPWYH